MTSRPSRPTAVPAAVPRNCLVYIFFSRKEEEWDGWDGRNAFSSPWGCGGCPCHSRRPGGNWPILPSQPSQQAKDYYYQRLMVGHPDVPCRPAVPSPGGSQSHAGGGVNVKLPSKWTSDTTDYLRHHKIT
jgi:hypothetical protein